MKNKVTLTLTTILLLTNLAGCGTHTTTSENIVTPEPNTYTYITPTPKNVENDANIPIFLRGLDTTKNADGTYSFKGCITSYKFSQYGYTPTIYITTTNGTEFSTSSTDLYYSLYINNSGECSTILNDLVSNPRLLKGILFEFVYDSEGNLVKLKQ